jgi:zinc protease
MSANQYHNGNPGFMMRTSLAGICAVFAFLAAVRQASAVDDRYCVVVSKATAGDADWKPVVNALREKHHGEVLVYAKSLDETLPALRRAMPRYIGFVARPTETGREFVSDAHHLTRQIEDAPYTAALWGIITGYDAAAALRIVHEREPLVIHRAAAATEIELPVCDEGLWYCELNQGKMVRKLPGGKPEREKAPSDTTEAMVDMLNDYRPQLWVTSGHASERDWMLGYRYRNGTFRCKDGQLYGLDTHQHRFDVHSDNAKVFLPVGNCLMGHVDGRDAMALAYMNTAGVRQMIGYTVTSWYGYAGWGMLDYFVEQPGRYSLAEAFVANEAALMHRLATYFPGQEKAKADLRGPRGSSAELSEAARKAGLTSMDLEGLLYDRDVLAFYGDPAWEARMAPGPLAWDQKLSIVDGRYQLDIKPLRGEKSFEPINTNGSQRGGRPFVQFLPERIDPTKVHVEEGGDLKPLITGRFVLVPNPGTCDPAKTYRIVFRAK